MHFDGETKGNLGKASSGQILSDNNGYIIAIYLEK